MIKTVSLCLLLCGLMVIGCSSTPEEEPVDLEKIKDNRDGLDYLTTSENDESKFFSKLDETMKEWHKAQQSRDHSYVQATERQLAEMTRGGFSVLVNALKGESPEYQIIAAATLGFSEDTRAIAHLTELIEKDEVVLRKYALMSIGMIGFQQTPIKPIFGILHKDPSDEVRSMAAFAILRIVNKEEPRGAIPHLLKALDDKSPRVRVHVLIALSRIGNLECVNKIVSTSLEHANASVRFNAVTALGEIGDEESVRLLIVRLRDPVLPVRIAARHALKKITEEDLGQDPKKWEEEWGE